MSNTKEKEVNKMKALKGLDEMKYTALLSAYLYAKTGIKIYMLALRFIIDETERKYGSKGVSEVIDFIQ